MLPSESYNSLVDLIREFPNDEACRKHLAFIRWGDDEGNVRPRCPHCQYDEKVYVLNGGKRYKCSACRKKFSVLVGTMFENTKISLQKWFITIWLATSHKKGLSSCQLAKDIGVTQKSAWYMLHRICEMLREKAPELLEGELEVDETFVGGKERWKHRDKRDSANRGRSTKTKTPVFGIAQRGGPCRFFVVNDTKGKTLQAKILESAKPGSAVYSDE